MTETDFTPSLHSARSTFAFARAKGDKSRRGMYFDAFDRMIARHDEAVEAKARAAERERIVSELRDEFGVTNRAASWIAREGNR
ncbi:hypothetical protein [Microbacterium gilvum]|uniref:Uncharacterized protein n=1 Tax=Microbacterium gilvum TaxID=1336204 RepID=A0ABP9A725_9MICO